MMTIPAWMLLVAFAVIFLIFVVVLLAHVYHGYRFGRHDPLTMTINSGFLIAVITIVIITFGLLTPVDWSSSFTLNFPEATQNSTLFPSDINQQP